MGNGKWGRRGEEARGGEASLESDKWAIWTLWARANAGRFSAPHSTSERERLAVTLGTVAFSIRWETRNGMFDKSKGGKIQSDMRK
jgi:hypothetical protein